MKNFFISILVVLLFFSCKKEVVLPKDNSVIEISSNFNNVKNIFDIIESPELVSFKSKETIVLKSFKKGVLYKNSYFFSSNNYDGVLYITNKKGEIISEINDIGNGPNEYRELTSFDIKNNELFIHDFQKQRFIIYNLDGEFLRIHPIAFNFLSFKFHKDRTYLYTAKHENFINEVAHNFDLLVLDENDKIIKEYLPFDKEKFQSVRLHKNNPFYTQNNSELLFNDIFSDTIYNLKNNNLFKKYAYNYLDKSAPEGFSNRAHSEIIDDLTNNNDAFLGLDLLANLSSIKDSLLITQYSHNSTSHFLFSSVETKNKMNYVFPKDIINDINYHKIFKPLFIEDDSFITVVYPYVLEFLKEEYLEKYGKEDKFTKKIDSILSNTLPDGNQVILKYKIKDF